MRRNKPGMPCCGCPVYNDEFERTTFSPDYDVVGSGISLVGSAGHRQVQMVYDSHQAFQRLQWHGPGPERYRASAFSEPVGVGDKVGIAWQVVGAGGTEDGKRYAVRVTLAAAPTCGTMELLDITDITSSTLLSVKKIPGFNRTPGDFAQAPLDLSLCYSPDTGILSASAGTYRRQGTGVGSTIVPTGKVYWDHVDGITIPPGPYTDSEIWLFSELTTTGLGIFRHFKVNRTKKLGVDDYYYYAPGDHCPCCGVCIDESITFPDDDDGYYGYGEDDEDDLDLIDCRLEPTGGVVKEGGVLAIASGGGVFVNVGWPGVNGSCEADDSHGVVEVYESPDWGEKMTIAVGDITATLTLNSDADTTDGTLVTSAGGSADVDIPAGVPVSFAVGVLGGEFVAGAGGKILSTDNSTNTGSDIVISTADGSANITSINLLSCLLTNNFEKFFHGTGFPPDGGGLAECGPCIAPSGQLPISLLVFVDGCPPTFGENGLNGTHIVDFGGSPHIGECQWTISWRDPPGGDAYTAYSITVTIFAFGGDAYIQVNLLYDSAGGEVSFGGQANYQQSIPLGAGGLIDCHELLGAIPFLSEFQFFNGPGLTVEVSA